MIKKTKISKVKKVKKEKVKSKVKRNLPTSFYTNGDFAYIPEGLHKFCMPIKDISLLEKNPRINDKASEKLAELIEENGFRKPIVIDQDGKVRAGNTAYKAAKILGMKFIPAAQSAFSGEAEAMRYVVSDNKASEYSYWDRDMLKELIESEKLDNERNIKGLGLSDGDLKSLFQIEKEKQLKHKIELAVEVESEEQAKVLFDELTEKGYKCRVLAL